MSTHHVAWFRRRSSKGFLYALPVTVFVVALFIVPLAMVVWMSFSDWTLIGGFRGPNFPDNFSTPVNEAGVQYGVLNDPKLFKAIGFTLKYTAIVTVILLGLALAHRAARAGGDALELGPAHGDPGPERARARERVAALLRPLHAELRTAQPDPDGARASPTSRSRSSARPTAPSGRPSCSSSGGTPGFYMLILLVGPAGDLAGALRGGTHRRREPLADLPRASRCRCCGRRSRSP